MEQYQTILILGIVLILLIMIDIYRRIKRKENANTNTAQYHTAPNEEPAKPEENQTEAFNKEFTLIDDREDTSLSEHNEVDTEDETEQVELKFQPADLDDDFDIDDESNTEEDGSQKEETPWQNALKATREKRFRKIAKDSEPYEIQESFNLESNEYHPGKEHAQGDLEDYYLVFHIIAPRGYVFYGDDIESIFNLRHYHLSINNTYECFNEDRELLLTVINANEPRTFGRIHNIQTSALTVYCDIRNLKYPLKVFKDVLSEAHQLAESLGGMLTNDQERRFTQSDFSKYMAKVKKAQTAKTANHQ